MERRGKCYDFLFSLPFPSLGGIRAYHIIPVKKAQNWNLEFNDFEYDCYKDVSTELFWMS